MPEELTPGLTLDLTLNDVQRARQRIASCVRRTPLVPSVALSERLKTNVYVKLELFQKTGTFKHKFLKRGTYKYLCTIHGRSFGMHGTIVVK